MRKTYYDILGISSEATDEDVRQAYRGLALKWHPDRNPENRIQAEKAFRLLNNAYAHLRTASQRKAYNRSLEKIRVSSARMKIKSAKKLSRKPVRPSFGFRRKGAANDNAARRFFGALKEIFWPLAE